MLFGLKAEIDSDVLLDRTQTALALTSHGFRISAATLATLASRGGGPDFDRYGSLALYRWGNSLGWAKNRTRKRREIRPTNAQAPAA
jgi:hypothetical protein